MARNERKLLLIQPAEVDQESDDAGKHGKLGNIGQIPTHCTHENRLDNLYPIFGTVLGRILRFKDLT